MLTTKQINRAYGEIKFSTTHGGAGNAPMAVFPEAGNAASLAESLGVAFDALAAYERVTALLERKLEHGAQSYEWGRDNLSISVNELLRALEG